jgi:hypothetical protein
VGKQTTELPEDSAMRRAKRKGKFNRETRPWWKWFRRRPRISEEYFPECGRRYFEKPVPKEEFQCTRNSTAALIYDTGRWGLKEFEVHLGRYKPNGREVYLSELFSKEDLSDVANVAAMALKYIQRATANNGRRR